ncbi:MAG: hypothetical protein LBG96_09845 [Tannerella sp.]|jgi:hypothetical protein|nr:hypothetical protein [Tannerella sp.]
MVNIGTTGIIPFMYFYGIQRPVGSTYLRVDPIVNGNSGFENWIHGKKYNNIIFQQTFWKEMAALFEGPKIIDICDPDWLILPIDFVETGNLVHAITCSSEELTRLVKSYFPDKIVEHVPDRLDFKRFPSPHASHRDKARKAVWFGYIHNAYEVMEQLLPALKEYNLELRIIANAPYSKDDGILALNPEFIKYEHHTVNEFIAEADLLLNPRSEKAYFKYKSNNKSITAWKLGLPVAVTPEDIARLMDPEERNREIAVKQPIVEKEYNITQSVAQYKEIISTVQNLYFS